MRDDSELFDELLIGQLPGGTLRRASRSQAGIFCPAAADYIQAAHATCATTRAPSSARRFQSGTIFTGA